MTQTNEKQTTTGPAGKVKCLQPEIKQIGSDCVQITMPWHQYDYLMETLSQIGEIGLGTDLKRFQYSLLDELLNSMRGAKDRAVSEYMQNRILTFTEMVLFFAERADRLMTFKSSFDHFEFNHDADPL